jgi:hypothetical protein
VAEQVEVVGRVTAAEAGVLHVLLMLLLLLLLLLLQLRLGLRLRVYGGIEVSEGVGEVVAWEAGAPVRRHRGVYELLLLLLLKRSSGLQKPRVVICTTCYLRCERPMAK